MNKHRKTNAGKKEKCIGQNQYWWIMVIYIGIPIILLWVCDKLLCPLFQRFMDRVQIGEVILLNSSYVSNNIIQPFTKSLAIILGFIISFFVLFRIQKILLKMGICFKNTKKCLRIIEGIAILLAIVIAVYGKADDFDYSRYGYNSDTIKAVVVQESNAAYIPLEKIPSIQSCGVLVGGNILYNMALRSSQVVYYLSDNLELIAAIAGAIIVPLENYYKVISK